MDRYQIVKKFFHVFEKLDYEEIIKLFTTSATIHSPLYGKKSAAAFYREMIADSEKMKVEIKNIFQSLDHPHQLAGHVVFTWHLRDGTVAHGECVDIFEFPANEEKIASITIIYDTLATRPAYTKMHG